MDGRLGVQRVPDFGQQTILRRLKSHAPAFTTQADAHGVTAVLLDQKLRDVARIKICPSLRIGRPVVGKSSLRKGSAGMDMCVDMVIDMDIGPGWFDQGA